MPESTVATYLLARLHELGVEHIFGVPGDFVIGFLNEILRGPLRYVGTCNELNAAYAADGYARIRGVGALVTTYGVGELSALNGVAGAFAERVSVVVITGCPTLTEAPILPTLHHSLGEEDIPRRMYELITVASTRLTSGETAAAEIDRVLVACIEHRRPVYIALPADVVHMPCPPPANQLVVPRFEGDRDHLDAAVRAVRARLEAAARPVLIGGVELVRFRLREAFAMLVGGSGIPYTTMMLAKGVLSEQHPQYIGLFEGDRSHPIVREQVAASDCILEIGAWRTDFNTGGFTAHLDPERTIHAGLRSVTVGGQTYDNVDLEAFMTSLAVCLVPRARPAAGFYRARFDGAAAPADLDAPVTAAALFSRVQTFLKDGDIVIAETGVSLFATAELWMPEAATFIGQTFYGSIGYTVGAALGAAVAAPDRRVVLLVGDGAFQMGGQEIGTMMRAGLHVVVLLLNNDGYTIERVISDQTYNDLAPWRYHLLPEVYGGARGLDVRTEGELDAALLAAQGGAGVTLVEVHTGRLDCSDALRSAGRAMAEHNQV